MLRSPLRRLAPAALGALFLSASLTACGGGPGADAPEDASQEEFCNVLTDDRGLFNAEGDLNADDVNAWAEDLGEVGTPEGIDGDARKGFEVFVDELAEADDSDLEEGSDGPKVSKDDEANVEKFVSSAPVSECIASSIEVPEVPTDAPS